MSITLNFFGEAYQYRVCEVPKQLIDKVDMETFKNGFLNFDFLEQYKLLSKDQCFISEEFICPLINFKTRFEIKQGRKILLKELTSLITNEGLLFKKYEIDEQFTLINNQLEPNQFLYIQKTIGTIGKITLDTDNFKLDDLVFTIESNLLEYQFIKSIAYQDKEYAFKNNNVLTQFETCIS